MISFPKWFSSSFSQFRALLFPARLDNPFLFFQSRPKESPMTTPMSLNAESSPFQVPPPSSAFLPFYDASFSNLFMLSDFRQISLNDDVCWGIVRTGPGARFWTFLEDLFFAGPPKTQTVPETSTTRLPPQPTPNIYLPALLPICPFSKLDPRISEKRSVLVFSSIQAPFAFTSLRSCFFPSFSLWLLLPPSSFSP